MYHEKRHIREATVIDCYGKFDEGDHDSFMQMLETLYADGCRYLVVNLSSVYQLSDKIVELLKFAYEYFSTGEGQFVMVSPLSSVRRDLEQAGIISTIPTYLTVYDSLHRRKAVINRSALTGAPSLPQRSLPFEDHHESTTEPCETATHAVEMVGAGGATE